MYYKVLTKERRSAISNGLPYRVYYNEYDWTKCPVVNGVECPLFIFDSDGQAFGFARVNCVINDLVLWECEAYEVERIYKVACTGSSSYSEFWRKEALWTQPAPRDSFITKELRLVREICTVSK